MFVTCPLCGRSTALATLRKRISNPSPLQQGGPTRLRGPWAWTPMESEVRSLIIRLGRAILALLDKPLNKSPGP